MSAPATSAAKSQPVPTVESVTGATKDQQPQSLEDLLSTLVTQLKSTDWVAQQPKDGLNIFDLAGEPRPEGSLADLAPAASSAASAASGSTLAGPCAVSNDS